MIDLTPVFQAIIALLAALITHKLIPWIKSKTTESQQKSIAMAAKIAVYAAEQVFGAGQGPDKFRYAVEAMRKAGFDIDTTLAAEAIENAVREMNLSTDMWGGDDDPEDTDDSDDLTNEDATPEPDQADAPGPEEAPEEDTPGVTEPPPEEGGNV